jgi:hypothetical protein
MDPKKLEETDVLSITLDQAQRFFEIVVCDIDGIKYKLSAWNADGAPIEIAVGAMQVRSNLTNARNLGILGELEGISVVHDVLTLEGDFGDFTIKADKILAEQLI